MEKMESTAGIPVFIAKEVTLSKTTIEELSEAMSEKIVEKLSTQIVEKFFQRIENLCIHEDSGLLGLILKDHLDEILEKEQRKRQEEDTFKRVIQINSGDFRPVSVFHDPIDVKGENEHWEQQKRKDNERGLE